MHFRTFSLFFLLLILSTQLSGQSIQFNHLSFSEYLPNQTVNAILKDSYGYMWFGTYDRLVRFDGYGFKSYLTSPGHLPGGQKCDVRSLLELKDKTLLVGTFHNGLFLYNRDKDLFINLKHDRKNPQSLGNDMILALHLDSKGNIWIGTSSGLDKFDYATGTFSHYSPFDKNPFVAGISEDLNGNLWLYGGNEICRFDPVKNRAEECIETSGNHRLKNILWLQGVILCDRENNLWIGNKVEGLLKFNLASRQFEKYSVGNKQLKSDMVAALLQDREGLIWVGTDGGGLHRYVPETNRFEVFEHDPNDPASPASNAIHSVYESEQGLIWVGFFSEGADLFEKRRKMFMRYGSNGSRETSLSNKSVLSIAGAADGKVWIGTDGGGLNLFDPRARSFTRYTEDNGKACANVVKCLYVDRDQELWSGSYRKGLCRMNGKGTLTTYLHDNKNRAMGLGQDNVWSLCEHPDGTIYIGLLNGGFDILNKKTGAVAHYPLDTLEPTNTSPNVQALLADSRKRVWIGTQDNGALCFDPRTGTFTQFLTGRKGSISSNDIRDIIEDSQGNLWFATREGLCVLNDENISGFSVFSVKEGLVSGNIMGIAEDNKGNLWISTDKGISCYRKNEKQFLNFDTEDGVQKKGFNAGAKWKSSNGYLFFGGTEGFTMFHPDSIFINKYIPPVEITDFKIFNHSVTPGMVMHGRKYLEKPIGRTKEIYLNYNDNVFSIEFAALNYVSPEKNRYAYRLEGFDREWTYLNAGTRFATYTNLNPGTYTFHVIGSNNDEVWNKEGTSLKIVVLPPWWMTWWFKIFLFLLIMLLVIGMVYLRTRSVKKQNKALAEEVRKQTFDLMEMNQEIMLKNKLLEENNMEISRKTARILAQQDEILRQKNKLEQLNKTKDKFFSIIAHDLRNPVNALTVLSATLKHSFHPADRSERELINNIDIAAYRIKGLVLNLLEWARTQTEAIKADPVKISVARLVEENIQLHYPQALHKEIRIHSDIEESLYVYADYNMTNTVVRNILSNSIKYTPRGGEVTIFAGKEGKEVSLSFKDTGIGIPDEALEKLFKAEHSFSLKGTEDETGSGLGMILSNEFMEMNGGRIAASSAPGGGSTFTITLPGGMEESFASLKKVNEVAASVPKEISISVSDDYLIKEEFRGKRILLVDDDEQVRNSVKFILSGIFEVYEAMDVNSAIKLSEEVHPDLVISDIVMPGQSGISFCQILKSNKITCHIPVLLLTGQGSEETHLEGLKAGADGYITKPFDRKIFLTTINNLLSSLENIKIRFSSDPEVLPSEVANSAYDEELLSRAIKFIEKNISDVSLNGEVLCKELGISKSLLYVKLKKLTGQTVNEFIRTIRLKLSTRLLLEGKMNISQISSEIGFNSPSYFTRSFTQHFGMSPKEYISRQLHPK